MLSLTHFLFLVAVVVSCNCTEKGILIKPCLVEDFQCVQQNTKDFLLVSAPGIPQYNIQPIDPMKVDALDQDLGAEYGIKHILRDLVVTGLKDNVLTEFAVDTNSKSVKIKLTGNIQVAGKLTVEYSMPKNQVFHGNYSANGDVSVTIKYPYQKEKTGEGIEHYVVGKEVIVCEALQAPKYSVNKELLEELKSHEELKPVRAKFHANVEPLMRASMCDLVQKIYPTVVNNIRELAKALPATAFFTNV